MSSQILSWVLHELINYAYSNIIQGQMELEQSITLKVICTSNDSCIEPHLY